MSKRIGFVLILGLVLAVFVSACGVALGPVQFTVGGPAILSPTLTGLHVPGLQQPAALSVMHEVQRWQSLQEQTLAEFGVGHCHGGE
jgi:hypothetical protein